MLYTNSAKPGSICDETGCDELNPPAAAAPIWLLGKLLEIGLNLLKRTWLRIGPPPPLKELYPPPKAPILPPPTAPGKWPFMLKTVSRVAAILFLLSSANFMFID